MSSQPQIQTYHGNCHCGRVKFTATLADIRSSKIVRCNCSICTKNGYLLVYSKRKDVIFSSSEDDLSAYRFGNQKKPHKFCRVCGTSILIDFSEADREVEREVTAVNVSAEHNCLSYLFVVDITRSGPSWELKISWGNWSFETWMARTSWDRLTR